MVIDATLRALSRHWLECYFNKTAKYDSVHIQARRLFSFETYDVSENDKRLLEESTQEYLKSERGPKLATEQFVDKNKKPEAFNFDFRSGRENQINEDGISQQFQNNKRQKTASNNQPKEYARNSVQYKGRKRMRRDASDPVLVREGIMKITDGVEWTDDFLNKSSQAYLQLEEMVLTMVSRLQ